MNILGIDTATRKANVCLKKDNTFFNKSIDNEITHSEKLLPLIDSTLKEANLTLKDIDYLACTTGPGSFTGIRIGLSTVKAFAKVIDKPIFAVSSMDVLAYDEKQDNANYVVSLMDSKNSRVYYSIYKVTHTDNSSLFLERISDYKNDNIEIALDNIISTLSSNCNLQQISLRIVGDCVDIYEKVFEEKFSNIFNRTYTHKEEMSGLNLVKMFENYINSGHVDSFKKNYLNLDALYVRPSQAERAKQNEL